MNAALPPGDMAVIFGSGLAVVPDGAEVIDEIEYAQLGWPATSVAGHPNRLLSARWAPGRRGELRVLLACGRPHPYEGWSDAQLARPVDDLASAGVRALIATNAVGALDLSLPLGAAVIVSDIVDLQREPTGDAPVVPVIDQAVATRLAAALAPLPATVGRYVAVAGPHYETPAEAAWLRGYGEVVGMSTATEVRAAAGRGLPVCVVSLVANVSGASLDHAEVLAMGARLGARLGASLGPLAAALLAELAAGPSCCGARQGGAA